MDQTLRCVFVAKGEVEAWQVRGFLEAAGISTAISGEAVRNSYGLTVDGLGAVEILVNESDVAQAQTLLESAEAGELRLGDDAERQGQPGQ